MVFVQQLVAPEPVDPRTAHPGDPVEVIQASDMHATIGIIKQIADFSDSAYKVFSGLFQDSVKLNKRISALKTKVQYSSASISSLNGLLVQTNDTLSLLGNPGMFVLLSLTVLRG
jgi:hypothetical protein